MARLRTASGAPSAAASSSLASSRASCCGLQDAGQGLFPLRGLQPQRGVRC